jgi:transposase InsO family protein
VPHSGRLQPIHRQLGSAGVDDESDIEIILERAKELHPGAKPQIISDNGPQFIAKDFKEFIRISGMTHVRTSPF